MRLHLLLLALLGGAGQTFDVVSIKPHQAATGGAPLIGPSIARPDGGLTWSRVPVALLIGLAHRPISAADMVGLPDWASREYFDITATASLSNPTSEDRLAMIRAMLEDRFQLRVHRERREVPSYDLVLARADGKLGPELTKSENNCEAFMAARQKEAEAAARTGAPPPASQGFDSTSPPPCLFASLPNGIKGELTLGNLAGLLRNNTGRVVVNKTGLNGYYRVNLTFAFVPIQGVAVPPPTDDPPSVFTAVREQLGLRLEPSRTERDVLVIDRLERPTEN